MFASSLDGFFLLCSQKEVFFLLYVLSKYFAFTTTSIDSIRAIRLDTMQVISRTCCSVLTVEFFGYIQGFSTVSTVARPVPNVDRLYSSRLVSPLDLPQYEHVESEITEENPLRVLIAGAGVGGLALANSLSKNPRMRVSVSTWQL